MQFKFVNFEILYDAFSPGKAIVINVILILMFLIETAMGKFDDLRGTPIHSIPLHCPVNKYCVVYHCTTRRI